MPEILDDPVVGSLIFRPTRPVPHSNTSTTVYECHSYTKVLLKCGARGDWNRREWATYDPSHVFTLLLCTVLCTPSQGYQHTKENHVSLNIFTFTEQIYFLFQYMFCGEIQHCNNHKYISCFNTCFVGRYSIVITTRVKGLKNGRRIDPPILNLDPRWSVVNTALRPLNTHPFPPGRNLKFGLDVVVKTKVCCFYRHSKPGFSSLYPSRYIDRAISASNQNLEKIFALLGCYTA